jgi:hypothetical protein
MAEDVPAAFDPDGEPNPFLARAKKKAAAKFRFTSGAAVQSASALAYWLHVFGEDDQAADVCRFLEQYQFAGNFNVWSGVEAVLTLRARLARQAGRDDEAAGCVARVVAAGYAAARLDGNLLNDRGIRGDIRNAVASKDKTGEREHRRRALVELNFVIALGGSAALRVPDLEREYAENLAALRTLLNVGDTV